MITIEEMEQMLDEITSELPTEFFNALKVLSFNEMISLNKYASDFIKQSDFI